MVIYINKDFIIHYEFLGFDEFEKMYNCIILERLDNPYYFTLGFNTEEDETQFYLKFSGKYDVRRTLP